MDYKLFGLQIFLERLDLGLQVLHLAVEDIELCFAFTPDFVNLNLGVRLLDFLGLLNPLPQPLLCLRLQPLLFLLGFGAEGVFRVHFGLEKVVVFPIMLLHMRRQLPGMCLFQRLDGLIVVFEILKLTLVILASLIKFLFDVLQVHFHVLGLLLVLFLEFGFAFLDLLLVELKVLLTVLPLLQVLLLELLDLLLELVALLELRYLVPLLQDHFVGLFEHDFHFFFVTAANSLLRQLVLLVF